VNRPVRYIRLRLGLVAATNTCVSQIINIASMAAFSNMLCGMIVSILAVEICMTLIWIWVKLAYVFCELMI
jgi:hypothetical protein